MVLLLARVMGVGIETADMLVQQVLSRNLRDRRAVARYAGLTGSPEESGEKRREKGLARSGNARVHSCTGRILSLTGQTDAAIAILEELPAGFIWRGTFLAIDYASVGRYDEAANVLLTVSSAAAETFEHAARLLRAAPTETASPQSLPLLGMLEFVYLHVGAQTRVLETYEGHLEAGYLSPLYIAFLWHPSYAEVRKTARLKTFARKAGLVEYWRAKGWPDFCRPVDADDFVCD
jgi:hypothetical protein